MQENDLGPILIEKINNLKSLSIKDANLLAKYIREYLIDIVSKNGGHLSSNLGVVELTLSLYRNFSFPTDTIIFDVSHQSYTHKLLSGRVKEFQTLRKKNGISGFTDYNESSYDIVHVAHAGTATSTAMGIHKAKQYNKDKSFTIAFVGDASMANGISFEALNNIESLSLERLIIILNDNQMSISEAVGAFSQMLNKVINHPFYNRSKKRLKRVINKFFGQNLNNRLGRFLSRIKNLFFQNYFENFGLVYMGPIDGHNIKDMDTLFKRIIHKNIKMNKPIIIHFITQKGKGDPLAEEFPEQTHGVSPLGTANKTTKIYSEVFEEQIVLLQKRYKNITTTTAAMSKGVGLSRFSMEYPNNFFDVGIAESHAVTFSSMLNFKNTFKPYICIYSTFFQRALDQVFQDVCLQQNAPVFILDRAGLVGDDGATHHGLYDISYLKAFPRIILASPVSQEDFIQLLEWSYHQKNPVVIRIPKAKALSYTDFTPTKPELGKGFWIKQNPNAKLTILVYGPILEELYTILPELPLVNIAAIRFAKPLDTSLLDKAISLNKPILTLEEHSIIGGVGESIKSYIIEHPSISSMVKVCSSGVSDEFIQHATRTEQLESVSLSGIALKDKILSFIKDSTK